MTNEIVKDALNCIKELEPLIGDKGLKKLQECMKQKGHKIDRNKTIDLCEHMREKLYISFTGNKVAGPKRYNRIYGIELRLAGTVFMTERR